MQAYHACISFIDAQIGIVFDALQRTGHWDDTIVVLTSDHGYLLGEKFMWGKVMLFETCDRVPLVIRVPRSGSRTNDAGSTSEGLVELVDLFPTLAELCAIDAPDEFAGPEPRADAPKSRFSRERRSPTPSSRVGQNLAKRFAPIGGATRLWPGGEELYDLKNDPEEESNVANSQQLSDTLRIMRAHLADIESRARSEKR